MQQSEPADFHQLDTPFLRESGQIVFKVDNKVGRLRYTLGDSHTNVNGHAHGGLLMTLLDEMLGNTGRHIVGYRPIATISLTCDFLGPALPGETLEGDSRVIHITRDILVIHGRLITRAGTVATATGQWKILEPGTLKPAAVDAQTAAPAPTIPDGFTADPRRDPFERLLGQFYRAGPRLEPTHAIGIEPRHANLNGKAHGGVLMTFADATLGELAEALADGPPPVTISQTTDFLAAVPVGAVVETRPAVVSQTPTTLIARGALQVAGRTVMTARSLWKIPRARSSAH